MVIVAFVCVAGCAGAFGLFFLSLAVVGLI